MKTIPLEKREQLKKEAEQTLKMLEHYPKKFDITVCVWAEGKSRTEAIEETKEQLKRIDFPATISSCEEVDDY
jgi:RNase H-fold protein (predicted Holliday junction resolvase)